MVGANTANIENLYTLLRELQAGIRRVAEAVEAVEQNERPAKRKRFGGLF